MLLINKLKTNTFSCLLLLLNKIKSTFLFKTHMKGNNVYSLWDKKKKLIGEKKTFRLLNDFRLHWSLDLSVSWSDVKARLIFFSLNCICSVLHIRYGSCAVANVTALSNWHSLYKAVRAFLTAKVMWKKRRSVTQWSHKGKAALC